MSKKKVESTLSWKAPQSVKDVPIFISFARFYPRLTENFSKVCKAIMDTLRPKVDKNYGPGDQNKTKLAKS